MQSSCFLQLCLKVNLVVERSPQLRERSEIIHHCSRGKRSGAKELSPGPPAPSPLRSSSLLLFSLPLFYSLLSSILLPSSFLFSSFLFSSLLSSRPFPSLLSLPTHPPLSLPSPSPHRPARSLPHRPTVRGPIIIFITRKISPCVCARGFSSLRLQKKARSHCSPHRGPGILELCPADELLKMAQ